MQALQARKVAASLAVVAMIAGGVTSAAFAGGHHHRHRHAIGIPQHNGGDHDSDNNGGPSDGDGNV
jgi:hypothetical protein